VLVLSIGSSLGIIAKQVVAPNDTGAHHTMPAPRHHAKSASVTICAVAAKGGAGPHRSQPIRRANPGTHRPCSIV